MSEDLSDSCRFHNKRDPSAWPLYDARGIFCAYVCDKCEKQKMSRYRADIFTDSNYWSDEPIDED